jgi:hypothetical protein
MKPHNESIYTNKYPPHFDSEWEYNNSLNTNVMRTWIKHGWKPNNVSEELLKIVRNS